MAWKSVVLPAAAAGRVLRRNVVPSPSSGAAPAQPQLRRCHLDSGRALNTAAHLDSGRALNVAAHRSTSSGGSRNYLSATHKFNSKQPKPWLCYLHYNISSDGTSDGASETKELLLSLKEDIETIKKQQASEDNDKSLLMQMLKDSHKQLWKKLREGEQERRELQRKVARLCAAAEGDGEDKKLQEETVDQTLEQGFRNEMVVDEKDIKKLQDELYDVVANQGSELVGWMKLWGRTEIETAGIQNAVNVVTTYKETRDSPKEKSTWGR